MRYLHTMVRVSNVDDALDFYCRKLGLEEVRRVESQQGRFTLIFLAALMFNAARQNCMTTNAVALLCAPQATHNPLLSKKIQKESLRRPGRVDATSHDATTVNSIAGHCRSTSTSSIQTLPKLLGSEMQPRTT